MLPFAGVVAIIVGAAMRAFAEHDIASTAASGAAAAAPTEECILTGTCAPAEAEVASTVVYLARDIGSGILVTGAIMIALGVAMVVWSLTRRPAAEPAPEGQSPR